MGNLKFNPELKNRNFPASIYFFKFPHSKIIIRISVIASPGSLSKVNSTQRSNPEFFRSDPLLFSGVIASRADAERGNPFTIMPIAVMGSTVSIQTK